MTRRRPHPALLGPPLAFAALAWGGHGLELGAQQPHWLGFRGNLGAEVPHGEAGALFQGNIRGEFSLLFQPRALPPWYFGFGAGWVTFHLDPAHTRTCEQLPGEEAQAPDAPSCEPWNSVGVHLLVGAHLDELLPIPLYLEGRLIERRLRPMDARFWEINSDNYIKGTPFPEYCGVGVEGVVGLRLPLGGEGTLVDLAARVGQFKPVDVDFDWLFEHLPSITGGWTLGLQLGLVWFP